MKKTERKDLGDHLSIYPKNMFDEAIKEKSQRRERFNLDPGESRVQQGRKWGSSVVIQRNPCQINRNQKKKNDLKNKIQVGTWNVRTMLRPGKLTNVIREMKRANLDVMGLAETRWKEEGDFTSDGVRIIHTGGENGQNGVAVLVEEKIARSIVEIERYGSRMIKVKI